MGPITESGTDSSIRPKPRFGRYLRWVMFGATAVVFLFCAFLIAITIPNLRREVAPPEISGVEQLARNAAKPSAPPTPRTLSGSADVSTSGTCPLNLDDFPHLSPTMRNLAQGWLDQCAETDRLIAAISDPALRAQALSLLKGRETRMRAFLNLPLEWESQPCRETFRHLTGAAIRQNPYGAAYFGLRNSYQHFVPEEIAAAPIEFLQKLPELADSLGREVTRLDVMTERMYFELQVRNRMWNTAAVSCVRADRAAHANFYNQKPYDAWVRERQAEAYAWEEEVYCMRQAGVAGLAGLTAHSYQRALDSLMDDPDPSLFYHQSHELLREGGDWVAKYTTGKQSLKEGAKWGLLDPLPADN